jgi:hypothetical protein
MPQQGNNNQQQKKKRKPSVVDASATKNDHQDEEQQNQSESTASNSRAQRTKQRNLAAAAKYKPHGNEFETLNHWEDLTNASEVRLAAAIDSAVAADANASNQELTESRLKEIAQQEVDELLQEQARSTQTNLAAAALYKSTGARFTELIGHDELNPGQKRMFNSNLETRIRTHPDAADGDLTEETIVRAAQSELTKAKLAAVTNLSGKHSVQKQNFSCAVVSCRNIIKAYTNQDISEEILCDQMRKVMGKPTHDFNTTGVIAGNIVQLLEEYKIATVDETGVSLDKLEVRSRKVPQMISFPKHSVILDAVTKDVTGKRTFHVRDPAGKYGGNVRVMSEAEFAKQYQKTEAVIRPTAALPLTTNLWPGD